MFISKTSSRKALVLLVTVLSLMTGPTALLPTFNSSVSSAQIRSKEDTLARMTELESIIANLKNQMSLSPFDKSLGGQLHLAIREYDLLSEQMGGDRAPAPEADQTPNINLTEAVAAIPASPPGCTPTTATFPTALR
jgi:hypothetical protein